MEADRVGNSRRDRRVKVLLDTNMLLLLADGIDIFTQIEDVLETKPEYIIIQPVLDELEKLIHNPSPKIRKKARFALEIAKEKCKIINYDYPKNKRVDDLIVKYALENSVIVATNDRELRKKLRSKGIPEIYLREEKMRLEAEGIELL